MQAPSLKTCTNLLIAAPLCIFVGSLVFGIATYDDDAITNGFAIMNLVSTFCVAFFAGAGALHLGKSHRWPTASPGLYLGGIIYSMYTLFGSLQEKPLHWTTIMAIHAGPGMARMALESLEPREEVSASSPRQG